MRTPNLNECLACDSNIDENEEALCNNEENNKQHGDTIEENNVELKILTTLNVLELLDFIQTWFSDNKVGFSDLILNLKDMVINEKLSRRSKITDFIKTIRK